MNNSIRLPNAPIFNREKFDCYYCEPEKFKEDFKSFTYLKDEEDIKKFFSDDQILDEDVFENNVSGTSLNKAASISSPKINCRHQSLLDWENISSGEGICQIQVYPDKKNSISLFEINETLSREVSKLKLVYDRNFENVERRNLQNICQQGGLISYGFQELDPCYEYWKFDYDWQNLICKRSPYFRKHHPAISFRYINADPYNLILPSKLSKMFKNAVVDCKIIQSMLSIKDLETEWFNKKPRDITWNRIIISEDPIWQVGDRDRNYMFDHRLFIDGKVWKDQSQEMVNEFSCVDPRKLPGDASKVKGKKLYLIAQCDQQFPDGYLNWKQWANRPKPSLREFRS